MNTHFARAAEKRISYFLNGISLKDELMNMKARYRTILLLSLALSFSSCWYDKLIRAYDGPRRPNSQLAILDCGDDLLRILELDDKSTLKLAEATGDESLYYQSVGLALQISPGEHKVLVAGLEASIAAGGYVYDITISGFWTLIFDAKAGEFYFPSYSQVWSTGQGENKSVGGVEVFIEARRTKEHVSKLINFEKDRSDASIERIKRRRDSVRP